MTRKPTAEEQETWLATLRRVTGVRWTKYRLPQKGVDRTRPDPVIEGIEAPKPQQDPTYVFIPLLRRNEEFADISATSQALRRLFGNEVTHQRVDLRDTLENGDTEAYSRKMFAISTGALKRTHRQGHEWPETDLNDFALTPPRLSMQTPVTPAAAQPDMKFSQRARVATQTIQR